MKRWKIAAVAARPMLVVSMANAASRVRGSKRTRKVGWDFSLMYSPSPKNTKSSLAASALRVMPW